MAKIFRLTIDGIEKGLVLKYRICFSGIDYAGGSKEDGDLMRENYFRSFRDGEYARIFGQMPEEYKEADVRIARVPFFYYEWTGDVESLLYFRFSENGWSIIESDRPELLIPFMPFGTFDKDIELGDKPSHREGYEIDNDMILVNAEPVEYTKQ